MLQREGEGNKTPSAAYIHNKQHCATSLYREWAQIWPMDKDSLDEQDHTTAVIVGERKRDCYHGTRVDGRSRTGPYNYWIKVKILCVCVKMCVTNAADQYI